MTTKDPGALVYVAEKALALDQGSILDHKGKPAAVSFGIGAPLPLDALVADTPPVSEQPVVQDDEERLKLSRRPLQTTKRVWKRNRPPLRILRRVRNPLL